MQPINWIDKYELGIARIDDQHRYFLELINQIGKEIGHPDDHAYLLKLLDELKAYAKYHFVSEENMMFRAGYPDYEDHKQHHKRLFADLAPKLSLVEIKYSEENLIRLIDFLVDWFFHHTTSEDKKFAEFLKQKDNV